MLEALTVSPSIPQAAASFRRSILHPSCALASVSCKEIRGKQGLLGPEGTEYKLFGLIPRLNYDTMSSGANGMSFDRSLPLVSSAAAGYWG